MKRSILYIFLSLLFVGCSSGDIEFKLNEIESVMDSSPALVLSELDSIAPEKFRRDSQRALYALLYSQALDKNYIDVTNDSLISIAVKYYEKSDDLYHKMLAHYYHGRVYYNAKDFPRSLSSMTKAFQTSDQISDDYWKGRIAEQIANIYDANFHGEDAIYYANVAYESLQKVQRQPYINYALLNLARIKGNNDKYDEAINLSLQVADSAKLYEDLYLLQESKDILAANYVGARDFKNAVNIFTELRSMKSLEAKQLSMYGISYLALEDFERANQIFEEIQQLENKDDLSLSYQIYMSRGDDKSALEVLNAQFDNLDKAIVSSMKQNFGQILSEIHLEEQIEKETQIRSERARQFVIVGIGSIIIVIVVILFLRWNYKNKKSLEKNVLIAQNLQEILYLKESSYSEATQSIKRLMAARFETIDNLCKTIYEYKETGLVKKKISAEIESLIEQMSSDKQKIAELEAIVDANYSNALSLLKKDLPNLKCADYKLYMYTALGFSINAIALFLKEEKIESVYNRKARLKNKIRNLPTRKASFYLEYMR